jgi:hypothetical protein
VSEHDKYSEDQQPCIVARMACGHYVAACCWEPDDIDTAIEFINDFRGKAVIEVRPVSFVRKGGLTFGEHCPTHIKKAKARGEQ